MFSEKLIDDLKAIYGEKSVHRVGEIRIQILTPDLLCNVLFHSGEYYMDNEARNYELVSMGSRKINKSDLLNSITVYVAIDSGKIKRIKTALDTYHKSVMALGLSMEQSIEFSELLNKEIRQEYE